MLEEQSSSACQKASLSEHSKPSYNIQILYLVHYNGGSKATRVLIGCPHTGTILSSPPKECSQRVYL